MKKLFLSLLLIGAWLINDVPGALAQTPFAPVGAEWYHDMAYGVFHSVVTGDTVINGISCRRIAVLPMVKNPLQAPPVGNLSTYNFYVYDNTDTVFIYNDLFGKFTPLYVFNVQAGDTLHLPLPPLYDCFDYGDLAQTDSQFVSVIDSVVIKNWDNVPLKTVYTHPVERITNNIGYLSFSYGTSGYVQSLGSVETGFLPECLHCTGLLDAACQPMGALRCYHETGSGGLSVALVDTCNNNVKTGIRVTDVSANFKLYPNPVQQSLCISYGHFQPGVSVIEIFDVLGRKVLTRKLSNSEDGRLLKIDIPEWSPGIYLLKIKTANGTVGVRKFVKE